MPEGNGEVPRDPQHLPATQATIAMLNVACSRIPIVVVVTTARAENTARSNLVMYLLMSLSPPLNA
jgi:hypothetical protein